MNHLTPEQFEDIIASGATGHPHLDACPQCRRLLAEKIALAQRLRAAFASVDAPSRLRSSITDMVRTLSSAAQTASPSRNLRLLLLRHRIISSLAAAAVILIALLPLAVYFSTPASAKAAQTQLAAIHTRNLTPHQDFYSDDDPDKLAAYFKDNLGFSPAFPCTGNGLAIRGCCLAHFNNKIAGSYVVDTPRGPISVIVVPDTPRQLGMTAMNATTQFNQTLYKASFEKCSMAAVRLGGYSYCAVGAASHDYLADLLTRLIPDS
jgi:hypothetical protein